MSIPLQLRTPINKNQARGGAGWCYALNWVEVDGIERLFDKPRRDPWNLHAIPHTRIIK